MVLALRFHFFLLMANCDADAWPATNTVEQVCSTAPGGPQCHTSLPSLAPQLGRSDTVPGSGPCCKQTALARDSSRGESLQKQVQPDLAGSAVASERGALIWQQYLKRASGLACVSYNAVGQVYSC